MDIIVNDSLYTAERQRSPRIKIDHFTRLFSKVVYKSRVVIIQENCLLKNQEFFFSHRTWQELVDLVQCVHGISVCKCQADSVEFISYPNENFSDNSQI